MNTNTLETLDYFRVRDTIAGYCMSQEASDILKQRLPLIDKNLIKTRKEESKEWAWYTTSNLSPALEGWLPCGHLFNKLGIEGLGIELEEAYALGRFCQIATKTKFALAGLESNRTNENPKTTQIGSQIKPLPHLNGIANQIPNLEIPCNAIFRIIDDSGQMKDLPELKAIRSSIRKIKNDIDNLIRSYTTNIQYKDALQSDVPALRSDRQVLAVKANFKGRINGIVHEVSQTGQTVFIEPDDVVQKNNDLIQEEFRLSQEIRRILKALAQELGTFKENFETAHTLMLRLDCAYGAARWGLDFDCTYALDEPPKSDIQKSFNTSTITGSFKTSTHSNIFSSPILKQARHPLLGDKAVPINVEFQLEANNGRGHRVLIITGPNTGGKTVTLKTIALLAMLNQTGFPVPAKEGTYLPIFTEIFADIGDDQSLDESLSTFSGHMKNIANLLEHADENSLILLDELGSGTDPQEGGAIAMATLDELIKRDSFVLVTTHHGILKNYGYTHPSCTNASVEFDSSTLAPTYRILMGVPGESHALDIAARNGLPPHITNAARNYISNNQADISALIQGLNTKHEELAKLEAEFREKEQRINENWRKVDLKALRVKQKELELREQGYKKSRDFLDENRKMLENLVRELREGEITREKTLKVKETIARLSESVEAEKHLLENEAEQLTTEEVKVDANKFDLPSKTKNNTQNKIESLQISNVEEFAPGIEVLVGKSRQKGILISCAKNGSWVVQVGSLKMTVKEKDLVISPNQSKPSVSVEIASENESSNSLGMATSYGKPSNNSTNNRTTSNISGDSRVSFAVQSAERPVFELRLLGMRYEQAMKALERQLDLCAIYNFKSFSVIHGKGNGILQEGVHTMLKEYAGIKEYHFAKPEDGGTGKTYVTLE